MSNCCPTPNRFVTRAPQEAAVLSAVENLAAQICTVPEYIAYFEALEVIKKDPQAAALQSRLNQIQYFYGSVDNIRALKESLESLPSIKAFRGAEANLAHLLQQVDMLVSIPLGLEFATNATHGGCG